MRRNAAATPATPTIWRPDTNRLVVGRAKPELHGIFVTSYDIPMRVEDCLICHNTRTSLAFAGSIHSLHMHSASFTNMGGSCDSCHATTLPRKIRAL